MMPNRAIPIFVRGLLLVLAALGCFSNLLFSSPAIAQGPENTLVVVNEESQDSLAIAHKYVALRDIPSCNVVYLRGVTNMKDHKFGEESTLSWKFEKEILNPILNTIKERGLEKQIDCIAYSAGFPTRVNFNNPELKTYLKQTNQKYQLKLHAPWASVTSLTYFHRNAFSKRPDFLELDANHFANPRGMSALANPFTGKDAADFDSALQSMNVADYDQAIEKLIVLGSVHRQQVPVLYNLAKCFAAKRERKKSLTLLQEMKDLGFSSKSVLEKDKGLSNIRSLPGFQDITKRMEDLPDRATPTRSFSSRNYWAKNGWPSGDAEQGDRYILSSVLAVTGKNRSTLKASLDRLESSLAADGSFPEGNVYFADHKDVRSKCRRSQFPFAVAELKSLGRKASIGPHIYPIGDQRVIGASLGSPTPKWARSKSSFLPGAICDNLTSAGASWTSLVQTKLTEFLDAGATGACGTVYEPYAIAPKFPSARWHAHYARGSTLAESYYQSVASPFQLLLVGDPLCCPFGKFPQFEIKGLEQDSVVKEDFKLQIEAAADSPKVRHYEMYYDGVYVSKVSKAREFKVETEAMNDGYHEMRIVAVADTPVANRRTQRLEFVVDQKGEHVALSAASTKIRLGQSLELTIESSFQGSVQIRQNSRAIATVASGKSKSVPAAKLGQGKCQLQAVVVRENGTFVRSLPLDIEVLP